MLSALESQLCCRKPVVDICSQSCSLEDVQTWEQVSGASGALGEEVEVEG